MEFFKSIEWMHLVYATILLLIGYLLSKRISTLSERSLLKRFSRHQAMIARRLIFYGLFIFFIVSALHEMGFELTVILGAAGVFTVAIGFASQTAASNLISGIFLLFDRPFKVGDLITVNSMSGYIEAIDLLSTKIKTRDNVLVRIPNETMIKSAIFNLSYFKKRRADLLISVSYNSDIDQVKTILLDLANNHPKAMKTPDPSVVINQFADSSIELKFMVWAKIEDISAVESQLKESIKKAFDKEKIEMPFPQITVHQA